MIITVPVRTELDEPLFCSEETMIFCQISVSGYWTEILLFTTLHDSSVAEIIANNRLTEYLSAQIEILSEGTSFEIHFNGRKPAIAMDGQQGRFG